MFQENQNIEHKRIWKDEYLKWISGFANALGGKIYIGIDDDLTVVGVDNLHKQLEDIPNKIINNTGVFPETNHLTIDGKKNRNPKMAQVFYRAGFIEAWGRGYEKIMKAFDDANLKRPEFSIEQGGVTAIIPREIFMVTRGEQKPTQTEQKPTQTEQKPTQSEQKNLIIELISHNPKITRIEITEKLGLHDSSVQRRLEALVREGKIRRVGPDKGGSWEIIK